MGPSAQGAHLSGRGVSGPHANSLGDVGLVGFPSGCSPEGPAWFLGAQFWEPRARPTARGLEALLDGVKGRGCQGGFLEEVQVEGGGDTEEGRVWPREGVRGAFPAESVSAPGPGLS